MWLAWASIAEPFLLSDTYHLQRVLPGTGAINCCSDFCAVESWCYMLNRWLCCQVRLVFVLACPWGSCVLHGSSGVICLDPSGPPSP